VQYLSGHGVTIISGLAYGIDQAAHIACLDFQVPTVGIMANGMDKIYPAKHKGLAKRIKEKGGALITEHQYGTMAEAHYFAARNRIIAAMSDLVIIVEAAAKGGALITAELANGYNKEILAVPGPINAPYSEGCNNLIYQNKAACLARFEDIVPLMNWDLSKPESITKPISNQMSFLGDEFNPDEAEVVTYLQTHPQAHIDEICRGTAIPINKMASILLNLEFMGSVRALPGKKFTLTR
jgi:DNA processing protein